MFRYLLKKRSVISSRLKTVAFFVSIFGFVFLGIFTLSPLSYAQTGSTYWNVERDASNNLKFYLTGTGSGTSAANPAFTVTAAGATQFASIANSGPYTNDWFRVNGNNGIYWSSWGGGWNMQDATYIRSYGNKQVLAPAYVDRLYRDWETDRKSVV